MMRAGKYYVGDLCYVMHDEWDEVCGLFFRDRDDHGCNEGEFNLKDGRRFVSYNTRWGDGEYRDEHGRRYGVDAGLIGCIRVEDIDITNDSNFLTGGNVIEFEHDFDCGYYDGVIRIGHIRIDTDPEYVEEDDYEYED
jgi:hypothetical protein